MNTILEIIKKHSFESFVLLGLFVYTSFYLTPSSYGYALSLLGMKGEGLIFGTPRPIRSDEWSVWTPYLQALINNDFSRYNEFSIYHEDFRNFNALPIFDWALVFKPQFWSFLIMQPARAFSFSHGLLIAAFLIGWKQLAEILLGHYKYATSTVFILFSLLLFFSGYVQLWWTTVGPIMAFFPWLMIVLLGWRKNTIPYYFLLAYVAAVWLLSHTYPPLIISSGYLGLFLLFAFQSVFFSNPKRILFTALSCTAAIVTVAFYYRDVINIMMDTVYPGQRVSSGGGEHWPLWLSSFVPYITHSYLEPIRNDLNICEASTSSSLLPLITACFTNYRTINLKNSKEAAILSLCVLFFSIWMLLPVPAFIGKPLLLTMVPGHRMLFTLGVTVNLVALTILLVQGVSFTYKRWLIFSVLIFVFWNLQVMYSSTGLFQKSALELVSIPLLFLLTFFNNQENPGLCCPVKFVVFTAFIINAIYFAGFNPLQSSRPIFDAANSQAVAKLKMLESKDPRGWLVTTGYRGAMLNGLGLKSFSHTLIQPQLAFFRKLLPELSEQELNKLFNRYAYIELYNGEKIYSPHPDTIRIPMKRIQAGTADDQIMMSNLDVIPTSLPGGSLDSITMTGHKISLTGWVMSNRHQYAMNLENPKIEGYFIQPRPDVVDATGNSGLLFSGFKLTLSLSDSDRTRIKQEGICFFSLSDHYGTRKPGRSKNNSEFDCKK